MMKRPDVLYSLRHIINEVNNISAIFSISYDIIFVIIWLTANIILPIKIGIVLVLIFIFTLLAELPLRHAIEKNNR